MKFLKLPSLVLCYHRIGNPELGGPSRLSVSIRNFRSQIEMLRTLGYKFVPLEEFSSTKSGTIAITFDDGYSDNYDYAAPILDHLRIPATFFISTFYVTGQKKFPPDVVCQDKNSLAALHRLMSLDMLEFKREYEAILSRNTSCSDGFPMSLEQLKGLAMNPLFSIGPHTHTHRSITALSRPELEFEISESTKLLLDNLPTISRFLAIPFGQASHVSIETSEMIYTAGFTPLTTLPITPASASKSKFGKLGIPRVSVGPWSNGIFIRNLLLIFLGSIFPIVWLRLLELKRMSYGFRVFRQ